MTLLAADRRLQGPISVVILTYNEARNIGACLESVSSLAGEIFVVDSGSSDGTVDVANLHGAKVVTHAFESHAKQWQWALENLPLSTKWVLALDADQRLTAGLREEISRAVLAGSGEELAGCFLKRKQIFRGRWIKHGGYYPKYLLKLFRRDRVWLDERELVDHHFYVRGGVVKLRHDLVEDNRNEADVSVWLAKHMRYASLQADEEFRRAKGDLRGSKQGSLLGAPDARMLWFKRIWEHLPLYVRPCLYFFYRYVVRLGFLDGKEGFVFHVLQGFWYRLLVDIRLDELRRAETRSASGR